MNEILLVAGIVFGVLYVRYLFGEVQRLRAHIVKMRIRIEWLHSELGATQDAAAQDVERWR